jgi:hypothetical protein
MLSSQYHTDRTEGNGRTEVFYILNKVYLGGTFNVSSFKRLSNELQKYVKTKPEDFHLETGSYCLGKFPGDGL